MKRKKNRVSETVIRRLPRYYRHLDEMYNSGVVRTSSGVLGARMGVTPSQIRQDLTCFGEFGQQGYGYNVAELRSEIGHILGMDAPRNLFLLGAGHLGHALLQNFDFAQDGFRMDAAFDVAGQVIGTAINGITVRSMDELAEYCRIRRPVVAVLTVPRAVAQETADRVVGLGVRGIWNFTNVELNVPEDVIIENVHFADSLLTLGFRITIDNDERRSMEDRR